MLLHNALRCSRSAVWALSHACDFKLDCLLLKAAFALPGYAAHLCDGLQKSKAAKRRERQAQQEAEREAAIAQEVEDIGETDRQAEEKALQSRLIPSGLHIVEIPVRCLEGVWPGTNAQMHSGRAHACALSVAAGQENGMLRRPQSCGVAAM